MNPFLVTYDLRKPESISDYRRIIDKIKAYGVWAKVSESTWIIISHDTVSSVRDNLMSGLDLNDKLFVVGIKNDWASVGITPEVADWLKNNL
jgi:hypothetical protein